MASSWIGPLASRPRPFSPVPLVPPVSTLPPPSASSAATRFVRAADRLFDSATPTSEYPYPAAGRVRFYLLTFEGVRFIDTDFGSIENGTSKYAEFFGLGQAVLTELRLVTQKPQ